MTSSRPTKKTVTYAKGTKVTVAKSRTEIESMLRTYGADSFVFGTEGHVEGDTAAILFGIKGRRYRIELRYPPLSSFKWTPAHVLRSEEQMLIAARYEEMRMWRELTLVIKAKLVAITAKIRTIEQEFGWDTMMPNNQTVGQWMEPQLQEMDKTGNMPSLLPGISFSRDRQTPQLHAGIPLEGEWQEE